MTLPCATSSLARQPWASRLCAHAEDHELTVVLFYRVAVADNTWEDVILVCEGEQSRLDAFVEMLRGSEPLLRCASTLMRQWSYTAQELHLPSERVGWGYHEWCDFAAQERYTHEYHRASPLYLLTSFDLPAGALYSPIL